MIFSIKLIIILKVFFLVVIIYRVVLPNLEKSETLMKIIKISGKIILPRYTNKIIVN